MCLLLLKGEDWVDPWLYAQGGGGWESGGKGGEGREEREGHGKRREGTTAEGVGLKREQSFSCHFGFSLCFCCSILAIEMIMRKWDGHGKKREGRRKMIKTIRWGTLGHT
jgi:hypothetical protein